MQKDKLKQNLAQYLGKRKNIFFHYKGRVSLYAILKAMEIEEGDEVIIPAYTCVVVPNPIIYAGAKPVYVDIDPDTYNMNTDLLEKAITSKTKVIVCQNTYGLSSGIEQIIDIAKKHKLYTIEDCTHGFGGQYHGKPNGTYCDASFFSMQWNKPFSSGVGGFALINNPSLLEPMRQLEAEKIPVSLSEKMNLKILYFIRRYLLTNFTYFTFMRLYRWLSKNNMVVGSSSGEEISSVKKPKRFFKNYSNVQAKEALRNLKNFDDVLLRRKKNARVYTDFLSETGKNHVSVDLFDDHAFLKYPLRVIDRDRFFHLAEKANIPLGDWFFSPIHPVQQDLSAWCFDAKNYPVAVEMAKKVVNLPTDIKTTGKLIQFLKKHIDLIEDEKNSIH
ncbi:MAG: aminotransferase class I/II-fold pyridoxal phosphate-dependent enzyme [Bacteroidales bacterium]